MPTAPTYPGVYIEEVPSEVRTITGVATSITAFIGRAQRGPVNDPVLIHSFADYARQFGGLWRDSLMSYSMQHYFLNGGVDALIIRVHNGAAEATFTLGGPAGDLTLEAANPGDWGDNLVLAVDHQTRNSADNTLFNLAIREEVDGTTVAEEVFRNLSTDQNNARFVERVLGQRSDFVRVQGTVPNERPDPGAPTGTTNGGNGTAVGFTEIADAGLEANREGIWALDDADIFNLLCIPPFTRDTDVDAATWTAAQTYCKDNRAMLIVDPPSTWGDPSDVDDGSGNLTGAVPSRDENAAVYFPRVRMADPLQENRLETFAPCGLLAGIYARTDAQRGVWKAPAGQEATLVGVRELAYKMTDAENGTLNPLGVNCLRTFPVIGNIAWGSRTTEGADRLASEWKYIPVRRLALFLEESLYRGTQWVIFEPNDEPLWAQIRLNAGAFMHNLFRQGAFQGQTPREAYFVKCDSETTTQNDINQGIVNLLVGFAPLRPAEFLIIKISQIAGEIQT